MKHHVIGLSLLMLLGGSFAAHGTLTNALRAPNGMLSSSFLSDEKPIEEEQAAALAKHNAARAEVGVEPLLWSEELTQYAQAWADYLAHEKKGAIEHRPRSGTWKQLYGENIFAGWGKEYSLLDATISWYSEIQHYKHGKVNRSNWAKTGHYTQIVWSKTTHIGMGKATTSDGKTIIVANYSPAGNMMGQKPY